MSAKRRGFWASGDPFVWLTAGALAFSLLMVAGLVLLILVNGLGFFWPSNVVRFGLKNGEEVLGQITGRERMPGEAVRYRLQVKQGNRELGSDFRWIDEDQIQSREDPRDAVVLERREWGAFMGFLREVKPEGRAVAAGAEAWPALQERLPVAEALHEECQRIARKDIGAISYRQECLRLRLRRLEIGGVRSGPEVERAKGELSELQALYREREAALQALRASQKDAAVFTTVDGRTKELPLTAVVRAYRPNGMGFLQKAGFYLAKVWEFVSDEPRESNTEGGVFPAIFGTVMMVIIMSLVVTPLGVLAAVYLREYAKQGPFVSLVRIAVNNLAGVPSIVFGVFGVGFFIYVLGGHIDRLFYPESGNSPVFGTGGILWASLTLALLTVPVVVVATEEGLAALPNGVREASLALGATKFETTFKVVLPAVTPSILTGLILAMARAAGEVAPLMITGVVKLAPSLPVDGNWPFLHLDRKFMHLGFHIFDVGFQSPNVDAARPMVYATTLLLLLIVLVLNLTAVMLRNHLRRKYRLSAL